MYAVLYNKIEFKIIACMCVCVCVGASVCVGTCVHVLHKRGEIQACFSDI